MWILCAQPYGNSVERELDLHINLPILHPPTKVFVVTEDGYGNDDPPNNQYKSNHFAYVTNNLVESDFPYLMHPNTANWVWWKKTREYTPYIDQELFFGISRAHRGTVKLSTGNISRFHVEGNWRNRWK